MPAKKKLKKSTVTKLTNPSAYMFDFSGWESMDGQQFNSLKQTAITFYRNNLNTSELQNEVYSWMKKRKYPKEQIEAVKLGNVSSTAGLVCRLLNSGCPNEHPLENEYWESLPGTTGEVQPLLHYVDPEIRAAMDRGYDIMQQQAQVTQNTPVNVVSIQDRMKEQVGGFIESIESHLDDWHDGLSKITDFHVYNKMISYEPSIKPAHAKIILDHYTRMIGESKEVAAFKDEDIKENYGYMKPKQRKEFAKFFADIEDACNMVIAKGQTKRKPRKKKAVDASKVVAKVQYKDVDKDLGLVSIAPSSIIGATELWTYNTKYRKLTKYVVDEYEKTLSVKGTTLQGFDKGKSESRTLRKPKEQLDEFKKAGKVALRKFMGNIKTKPSVPNGRLNSDTVLLKVV